MKLIPSLLAGVFIATSSLIFAKSNAIPVTDVLASATEKASQTNTVMHYGSIEVTAGNLKTVLADQLATITSLTLTGTIDARDFKTMRDDMPALTEIDLSDVTIVAYNGTNGTYDQSSYDYPENFIPCFAFYNPYTGYPKSVLVSITFPSSTTSIGGSAFWDCDGLTSITIPSSVTSIGPDAFWDCDGLTSMTIPSSVTTIGRHAFSNCSGLTSITIPSSVISIEDGAFLNSGLINVDAANPNYSSIDGVLFNKIQTQLIQCPVSKEGDYTVPSTVLSIMKRAFFSCNALTSVTIPLSVKSIGTEAYYDCTGLRSINIYSISPINLDLSSYAFQNVNKITTVLNVPYGSKTMYQAANHWNDFVIINEMPGLFLSYNKLGMDANEDTAFVNISSNVSWTATSDQTWLTINPASGIAGNETVTFTAKANPSTANRLATVTLFASGLASQTITLTQYGKFETTAGNLKTLLSGQLSSITSLTLHGTIDARDFKTMRDDMPVLTEIDLSDVAIVAYTGTEGTSPSTWGSIRYPPNEIPQNAFTNWFPGQYKTDLKSFIFPSLTNSIGSEAFIGCRGLTSFLIPSSVTTIGNNVFKGCNALFTVDAKNPSFSALDGILFNKGQTELIRCPVSKTGHYTIPSSVTSIRDYAFLGCYNLKDIAIPSSVTSIGRSAFFDCTGLKEITIPSSIKYIGGYAFGYAWFLTSIKVKWIKPLNISSSPQVFQEVNSFNDCTLNVPYGSKTAYQAANQWKDFSNIVEMPGIILSSNTLNMNSIAGTAQINLSSNINWTATSDQSWLTINPTAGTTGSSQTITFTATENPTWVNRIATVTLSGTGIESQTITVTQKGHSEVTAGNLKSILAGQLSTIIKLKLTGTIDARDFKTMRDDMPALNEIDLSEVTIVEI